MKSTRQRGFSLIELMVALTIGLILVGGIIAVYLAQVQTYKTTGSQGEIQDEENALAALVTPAVRSAGFLGCSNVALATSNLNPGGSPPLGNLGTVAAMVTGYDYTGTAGSGTTFAIAADNPANDASTGDWSPTLDASLSGDVLPGSDVLVVLGAAPLSSPTSVAAISAGSSNLTVQSAAGITSTPQFAAISDCAKALVFQVTSVAGTTLGHTAGSGALANQTSAFTVNFQPNAQFIPLQQTAFFAAHNANGDSTLMRATLLQGNTWNIQPLVPGVETMQLLYGVGANGVTTQYVPASAVTDWTQVNTVRLGFLLEGQPGSGSAGNNPTTFNVLGTQFTVPADTRLRHVYEMTINVRNS